MKNIQHFIGLLTILSFLSLGFNLQAQTASLRGRVLSENDPVIFADVSLKGTQLIANTNDDGEFIINNIPEGTYWVEVFASDFISIKESITLKEGESLEKNFSLVEDFLTVSKLVVSGSRYKQDRKNNPVVVGVIDDKLFNATQSIAISEGLSYSPGVRVETNCQNCGFTQVRLNGLEGSYSQILINSRPIFSALNSVYGLDQIPTNIVDRIEIVRGGGSALYGSNAIAGTVNIITKEPVDNSWEVFSNTALVDGDALDQTFNINGTIVNESLTSGISIYGMNRNRDSYDADGDGFTELVELENTVLGAKAFFKPKRRSKITLDISALEEYRRGGDQLHLAPHFTNITEELDHNTIFGGLNFEQKSKNYKSKWSIYGSAQRTDRDSYYGGLGGSTDPVDFELALNSYGSTKDFSLVAGVQFNHKFEKDVLTAGVENQTYDTDDEVAGFNRVVDQNVNTTGIFAQYEWKPFEKFTALLGARYDMARVDGFYSVGSESTSSDVRVGVFSPRFSLFYKATDDLRFRAGYARGFRAPQAFNEDLHISSAGGDQVISILSDNLVKETSDAFTASLNYTQTFGRRQVNFLAEGFYNVLSDPFTTVGVGNIGDIILEEVVNGEGATVAGANFEAGYSPSKKFTFQLGGTIQRTAFDESQELFNNGNNTVAVDEFVRNPNLYGYFTSYFNLSKALKIDLTGTYTGSMIVPRITGADGFVSLINTDPFLDVNLKGSYNFKVSDDFNLELSTGFRNIFDSYQEEFDQGPERDSDFIFGPAAPRSVFFSVRIGDFL